MSHLFLHGKDDVRRIVVKLFVCWGWSVAAAKHPLQVVSPEPALHAEVCRRGSLTDLQGMAALQQGVQTYKPVSTSSLLRDQGCLMQC